LVLNVENEEGVAFSKPIPARVVRVFEYRDRDARERGLDFVIRTARATGWRVGGRLAYPMDPYFGAK
jgi:hypothetical protein